MTKKRGGSGTFAPLPAPGGGENPKAVKTGHRKSENPKHSPAPPIMRRKQHNSLDVLPAMFDLWTDVFCGLYTLYTGRSVRMRPQTATEPCVSSVRRRWQHRLGNFHFSNNSSQEKRTVVDSPPIVGAAEPRLGREGTETALRSRLQLIHYGSTWALLLDMCISAKFAAERSRGAPLLRDRFWVTVYIRRQVRIGSRFMLSRENWNRSIDKQQSPKTSSSIHG